MATTAATLPESRLKVGIDVPWVTSWTSEPMAGVGPCATVDGRPAVRQSEKPGFGRPLYSMNHFRRQRATMRGMLCPMCGAPTQDGDRWSQTGKWVPAGVLRARGLGYTVPDGVPDERVMLDAGSVSPGHRACMARALVECPHLRTLADRELKPFPEQWTLTPLLLETMADPTPLAILAQPHAPPHPVPVIGFLQLCGVTDAVNARWKRLV